MSLQPGPYDPASSSLNPTPEPRESAAADAPERAVSNPDVTAGFAPPDQAGKVPPVVQPEQAQVSAQPGDGYPTGPTPAASIPGPPADASGISAPPPIPPLLPPPPPAWPPAPQAGPYPGSPPGPVPGAVPPGGGVPPLGSQMGYPLAPAGSPVPVVARQTDSKAVVGLVLAIASWVACPVIPAIIALVLASQSNRDIDASGGRLDGRGLNTATKVISWVNIALSVLAIATIAIIAFVAINGTVEPMPLDTGSR